MPSPFPGMDPYLEAPAEFPSLHYLLIAATVAQLQPQLSARGYFASPGERVWLTAPGRAILPDAAVVRRTTPAEPVGTTGTSTVTPVRVRRERIEVHESYVEIIDANSRRIVSGIEFVSPSNKLTKSGRRLYRRKQRDCRAGGIHLVEIDLIRRGRAILAVPSETVSLKGRWDYVVNTIRIGSPDYEFYPIRLRERLPSVLIPLRAGEDDVELDIQRVFDDAYDTGAFAHRIDYTLPPSNLLADDDAAWAEQLLKDKGLRAPSASASA